MLLIFCLSIPLLLLFEPQAAAITIRHAPLTAAAAKPIFEVFLCAVFRDAGTLPRQNPPERAKSCFFAHEHSSLSAL
jgi:hypothetical protein